MKDTSRPKKEKGTINSTHNSVKNHVQDSEKYFKYKLVSGNLIERLISEMNRDLVHQTNDLTYRRIQNYISLANRLKLTIYNDPRYPHQLAQAIIDNSYGGVNKDSNVIGAKVSLNFHQIKYNSKNYIPYVEPIFKKTR